MGLLDRCGRIVQITRIARHGNGLCVILNSQVKQQVPWNLGDPIAVRKCGDMLLFDRIDLSEYAKLKTSGKTGKGSEFEEST